MASCIPTRGAESRDLNCSELHLVLLYLVLLDYLLLDVLGVLLGPALCWVRLTTACTARFNDMFAVRRLAAVRRRAEVRKALCALRTESFLVLCLADCRAGASDFCL